jgi:hypothetical protein
MATEASQAVATVEDSVASQVKANMERLLPTPEKVHAQPPLGTEEQGPSSLIDTQARDGKQAGAGASGQIKPLLRASEWQMAPIKPETLKHRAKR